MAALSDGWFEVNVDDSGRLSELSFPWMRRGDIPPIRLGETFGLAFIDADVFVPPDLPQRPLRQMLDRSPAIASLLRGQRPDLETMEPIRSTQARHPHSFGYTAGKVTLDRIVSAHPTYPVPVVTHRATNRGTVPVTVNYYWCIGTVGDYYGVLSEKGDLLPQMLDLLGGYCAVHFIATGPGHRADNTLLDWAYVNLNFGELPPGASRSFDIGLWAVQHLWIGTQFSGYAYVLSDPEPAMAVAVSAAAPGHIPDAGSWLLGRRYSPIFPVPGRDLPEPVRRVLKLAPIRLLLSDRGLDEAALGWCAQEDIRVVTFGDLDPDPFVAAQRALDEALGLSPVGSAGRAAAHTGASRPDLAARGPPTIVNILPDDPSRQLLLSYYYGLRRDMAKVSERLTAPAHNVFIRAASLPDPRYEEMLRGAGLIRVLGSASEIGFEIEQWAAEFGTVRRHAASATERMVTEVRAELAKRGLGYTAERADDDALLSMVISFFAYHDYTLARLAIESTLHPDPESSPRVAFVTAVEDATGEPAFWGASLDMIRQHAGVEVFGPPFSVVVPMAGWGPAGALNAVLGAQQAKALRACLLPLHPLSESARSTVRDGLSRLQGLAYDAGTERADWAEIDRGLMAISDAMVEGLDVLTRFILQAGAVSEHARPTFGQRGVYLYHADNSLPLELVQRHERFGRHNVLGTLTLYGRMASEDPLRTAVSGVQSVLCAVGPARRPEVVLAFDPTGDLPASILELPSVALMLGRMGVPAAFLLGRNKTMLSPDDDIIEMPWGMDGPFRVTESTAGSGETVTDEEIYEFEPIRECTVDVFEAAVSSAGAVHFTGHGSLRHGSPVLVLSDGDLPLEEFPPLQDGAWLFLNACELGQAAFGTVSAMCLLEKGAVQVIAPLLAVRDFAAAELATLYEYLPALSFPAAFHIARHDAFLTSSKSLDHLVYVLYGDPFTGQGSRLWEVFEGYYCDVHAWRHNADRLASRLTARAIAALTSAAAEADRRGQVQGGTYWPALAANLWARTDANTGALREQEALAVSGPQRVSALVAAADAYHSSAQRHQNQHNQRLMSANATRVGAEIQLESVVSMFRGGRLAAGKASAELRAIAEEFLRAAEQYRAIGAGPDADRCAERAQAIGSAAGQAGVGSAHTYVSTLTGLLQGGAGDTLGNHKVAEEPSMLAWTPEPSGPSVADLFVPALTVPDPALPDGAASFLADFAAGVDYLIQVRQQIQSAHMNMGPTDVRALIQETVELSADMDRHLMRIMVNNALLKQFASDWLYSEPMFVNRLGQARLDELVGFSALLASLSTSQGPGPALRDYAQTYVDLFWDRRPRVYLAADSPGKLKLRRVDELVGVAHVSVGNDGLVTVARSGQPDYLLRADEQTWADLYACLLIEQQFQLPCSQRFRVGRAELSIRFGLGGIIDLQPNAVLCGDGEDLFYEQLESQLTRYLAGRVDGAAWDRRLAGLADYLRGRISQDFLAQDEALDRLGIGEASWSVLQARGMAIAVGSSALDLERRLAGLLEEACDCTRNLIRQRFAGSAL